MVTYNRKFQHIDWIDGQDIVQAGGERGFNTEFHALEAEFDNLSPVIAQLTAGLGAFQPVGAGGAVAYSAGNVGIGAVFATTPPNPPNYRLQVDLGVNTGPAQQARFGNAVCCNGSGPASDALFCHISNASDNNFALRQGSAGEVQINAALGKAITFSQGGAAGAIGMGITTAGHVVIGSDSDLPPAGTARLQVLGEAFKQTPGSSAWQIPSDARLKEDVRDLDVGLAQLRRVRPVRFRCNGRAGMPVGLAGVGIIGQEIEEIFPEMIKRIPGGEPGLEDLKIYDGSALTYVLVNAVKELAAKVEQLEHALAEASTEQGPTVQRA